MQASRRFSTLSTSYETEETRGFFWLNAVSLLFTISAVFLSLVGLSATVILPWVLENVFLGWGFVAILVRWL